MFDQPVGCQLAIGMHDRRAIDVQEVGQRPLWRQAGRLGKNAGENLLAQVLVNLTVDRNNTVTIEFGRDLSPSNRSHRHPIRAHRRNRPRARAAHTHIEEETIHLG